MPFSAPDTAGMDFLSIFFIAVGLAMDAFAVSVASGLAVKRLRAGYALKIALFFGIFQGLMPVAGWLLGHSFRETISHVDHWLAFGLLALIGGKMIYESFKLDANENPNKGRLGIYMLLVLSVATSIDAFAVGLTLTFIKVPIATPAVIIGVVTFVLSYAGVFMGKKFGHFFERKIEAIGGIILIGIGLKILIEHLTG